ncbi:VWA domain-containing protein [Adhaeribacter sp. BT258]|uniref:VWA domain-containing protein n=1 Tax=Adhaeribacter terrigena TaxID=2793070 RepID=A0ABS1C3A1_9BACT|nr:VWA domain-containing protein [Adhaeribacter terrigena]MBK0403876.1 VWA domain-containing protein [Adhaeribacter terrigena]
MTWSQPFSLLELIFGIIFILLYAAFLIRMKKLANTLHQKPHLVWLKMLLRITYFTLLLIALLGPSFGAATKEIKTTGKDILVAVDLSQSMNATDVQPSRLEKVKFELPKLLQEFNSDRIGLLIFSSEAFVQSPLTFDQNALKLYTETLNTNLVPHAGTELAAPLEMALQKFKEEKTPQSQQTAKILVLISDGEDFGENLKKPLQELEKAGVKVFSLGVGSADGGNIPEGNGFKLDNEGNKVVTKLNIEALQEIASKTNGEYFEINQRASEINKLISAINNVKGNVRQSKTIDVKANKYFYPLLLALLLMLFDATIRFNTFKI